jgi:uncharacterized protein YbaR (Trm112 family)
LHVGVFTRPRPEPDISAQTKFGAASRKKRTDSPPERLEGTVDPKLLDILVCPTSKGALQFGWTRQELISRAAKLAYPIRDGSPMTLLEKRGRSTSLAGKGSGARGMSAFACAYGPFRS